MEEGDLSQKEGGEIEKNKPDKPPKNGDIKNGETNQGAATEMNADAIVFNPDSYGSVDHSHSEKSETVEEEESEEESESQESEEVQEGEV